MKPITLAVIIVQLLISNIALGQKTFITCPETFEIQPRIGILTDQKVNLVFFNSIVKPKKLKEDCPTDTLINAITNLLTSTYPDAKFSILPSSSYYLPSDSNAITIKILLKSYGATLGKDLSEEFKIGGGYSVSNNSNVVGVLQADVAIFYPSVNQIKKETKVIESIAEEQPWMTFTKTAIKANNAAFKKSYFEITSMIDLIFLK